MARRRATVPSLFSDVVCISLSHDAVILATGAAARCCLRLQAARAAYFIISAGSRGFAAEAVGTTLPSICSLDSSSRLISRKDQTPVPLTMSVCPMAYMNESKAVFMVLRRSAGGAAETCGPRGKLRRARCVKNCKTCVCTAWEIA